MTCPDKGHTTLVHRCTSIPTAAVGGSNLCVCHILPSSPASTHRHSHLQQLTGAASVKFPHASTPTITPTTTITTVPKKPRITGVHEQNCWLIGSVLCTWIAVWFSYQIGQEKAVVDSHNSWGLLANPVRIPEHPSSSAGVAQKQLI